MSSPNKNPPRAREDEKKPFLESANERFQERATNALPSALAGYSLIGSILLFGLIGYGIDRWRGGTSHTFLLVGVFVGIAIGFFDLVKLSRRR
jgi:F0F1-type ATP synthase assembly protein I